MQTARLVIGALERAVQEEDEALLRTGKLSVEEFRERHGCEPQGKLHIDDVIRLECERRGWMIADLAERAGIDRYHVAELPGGKRSPNVTTLEKMCNVLGIRLSALFLEAERLRDTRR
jgi:ribosome-binding protein aMBF1 (putative translation factor)